MSFLTSICVSDIGSIPQDGLVNIFTDSDNYTTPIQTNVAISAMTGNNCPYYLSVPSGTTLIHIDYDNSVRICLDIFDPCTSCDLGFDFYSQNSIGQIVVGNLTGSCGTITDYLINWYGPLQNSYNPANPNQNIAFTSGKGTLFTGYNFLHPMTGSQSPPMIPGYYVPVISKVKLGTTIYSLTGGSGTVQSNLNCLYPTVVISAYTCSDTNTTGDYSTQINFNTTGEASIPPNALSTVLKISTNINYLSLYFDGYNISDTLKIQFSGTSYSTPLTLEYIRCGTDVNDNFSLSLMPKTKWSIFKKVLCFTGLTRTSDDYLLISIIPNQTNNATSWLLKWKCLETFDCTTCIDNYKNTPYKIFGSSISSSIASCNVFLYNLTLTGCSNGGFSSYMPGKYFNYFNNFYGVLGGNGTLSIQNRDIKTNTVSCNGAYPQTNAPCRANAPGTGTITTTKFFDGTTNVLKLTFTDVDDFNTYYDSYYNQILYMSGNPTNPLAIEYYRAYQVQICVVGPTQNCGDNSSKFTLWIHPSSVLTTGLTNNEYSMTMTMPTITKQITFTNCELNCDFIVSVIVNDINNSANSGNFSITSNVGARFTQLSYGTEYAYKLTSSGNTSSIYGQIAVYSYSYRTYVYSGGNPSYTIISPLTSTTCTYDVIPSVSSGNFANLNTNKYRVYLPNTSDLGYFQIYGNPLTNWNLGVEELAYTYSGGTVLYSNPNYIV